MTRRVLRYICTVALGALFAACGDDTLIPDNDILVGVPGTVTIQFRNSESTRAENENGDNPYSGNPEYLIENLFVALYPDSPEENIPAVAVTKATELTSYKSHTLTMKLTSEMVGELFNNADGSTCKMFAFANLTSEQMGELGERPTISDLKSLAVDTDFLNEKMPKSFVMAGEGKVKYTAGKSASSIGYAIGEGELYRAAAKIMLNLKVSATVTTPGSTEEWEPILGDMMCMLYNGVKDAVAYPVPDEDENGWKPANVSAYFNGNLKDDNAYRKFIDNSTEGDEDTDNEEIYPYGLDTPFYTYPNTWVETPDEQHKTVMTLMVPWKLKGSETETRRNYYYQVPITPAELPHIDRNYSYTVNLNVGMLGSLDPDKPLPTEEYSYQIVNWSQADIDVDMNEYRYLVVNPNVYTVHNEEDIIIPFYTSHPVSLSNVSITFEQFAFVSNGKYLDVGKVVNFTIDQEQINLSNNPPENYISDQKLITYEESTSGLNQAVIRINHPLTVWRPIAWDKEDQEYYGTSFYGTYRSSASDEIVKEFADEIKFYSPQDIYPAYFPFVIRIHIAHSDNPNFSEDVTITQYPAMYIQADRNPTTINITEDRNNVYGSPNPPGNVYVNGVAFRAFGYVGIEESELVTPQPNDLGSLRGIYYYSDDVTGGSQDKNPNMYIITITQLSEGSEFVIGDPRSQYYTNDLGGNQNLPTPISNEGPAGDWCEEASALYNTTPGGERKLAYYYPTIESEETQNMIAPVLRLASNWGQASWETDLFPALELWNQTRELARRRIATYQEQGFPAGRWRLPTYAEFQYIVTLSFDKKIPEYFTKKKGYWTAQGLAWVDDNGGFHLNETAPSTTYGVRGVYDEWYWNKYPEYSISKTTFDYTYGEGRNLGNGITVYNQYGYKYTLGDMPRGTN